MTDRIYVDSLSPRNKLLRGVWTLVYFAAYRWLPKPFFGPWRIFLLRLFGAQIGRGCKVDSSCHVWAPWNLTLEDFVCMASHVDCYSVDKIHIESNVTISQRTFICTASHDISTLQRPLIHAPITIRQHAWVCAEAFIGPGVTIGEGAVVAARAVVIRDVAAWSVVAGNPAKKIKDRNCDEKPN